MTLRYAIRGSNDEVTTCDRCGRRGLKATVMLEVLDADGNGTGEIHRFGVDCAANAANWTQQEVRTAASSANAEQRENERREQQRKSAQELRQWESWLYDNTGKSDVAEAIRALGGFSAARLAYHNS